jgi:hypothetical protein
VQSEDGFVLEQRGEAQEDLSESLETLEALKPKSRKTALEVKSWEKKF